MKNKTQMIFLIGVAVSAVLLIGVGIMLFLSVSKLKQTERAIDSKRRELA
ncbi:MAG: hypothetical protein GWM98_06755, partial [Nitrospinaceae bacterium]|nr:hypothetical protein [Nitrospinaceae bacterium]